MHVLLIVLIYVLLVQPCFSFQKSSFLECLRSYSLKECLIQDCIHIDGNFESTLSTFEIRSVPDSQGWSRCQNCSVGKDRSIVLHNISSPEEFDVAWSLWGEFFHEIHNDRIRAKGSVANRDKHLAIQRPVFIVQMITFHIGHILVDLLEQVYFAMKAAYGTVRRDALIVIDVANSEERQVLQEKLLLFEETIGNALIRTLSELPLIAMDTLLALPDLEDFVFQDLHVGLDNSLSYFHVGFQYQPCVMSLSDGNDEILKMSARYREFSAYVRGSVGSSELTSEVRVNASSSTAPKVVFVQRDKNGRVLLNLNATIAATEALGLQQTVQDLSSLSSAEQIVLFQEADVLVCAAGTALHNMLLMRPYTAVIILMQPSWCEWSWMYANQAVLLHIRPLIYCTDEQRVDVHPHRDAYSFHQWSRQFWQQGPRLTKGANITVDVDQFSHLLLKAKNHILARLNTTTAVYSSVKDSTLMCPGGFQHNPEFYPSGSNKAAATAAAAAYEGMPIVEIYISSVRVTLVSFVDQYSGETLVMKQISVSGEIGMQHHLRQDQYLLASLPHLSVCVSILSPATDSEHWCYPVYGLNYLSELRVNVPDNVYLLHFWIQASPEGGKFRHSDVYFAVDCSLPNGGFDALNAVLAGASNSSYPVTAVMVDTSIIDTLSNCSDNSSIESCHPSTHRRMSSNSTLRDGHSNLYALQQSIVRKCRSLAVSSFNCGRATAEIFRSLIIKHHIAEATLPEIQHFPTPTNLFVFLHIEKTGGTTVRE